MCLFGDPAVVLKKELLNIPIWGWYLQRKGMIPIDRAGRSEGPVAHAVRGAEGKAMTAAKS